MLNLIKKIYIVVEAKPDGLGLFEGSALEVAKFIGQHPTNVRRASKTGALVKSRYRIESKFDDYEPSPKARKVKVYEFVSGCGRDYGTAHELAERYNVTPQLIRRCARNFYKVKGRYSVYEVNDATDL